jgi:hypothetical protein
VRSLGVQSEHLPFLFGLEDFVYRLHRTSRNTGAAIDADIRIDVAALAVGVEALHRAMFDAVRIKAEAAIVRNDMGHDRLQSRSLNSDVVPPADTGGPTG